MILVAGVGIDGPLQGFTGGGQLLPMARQRSAISLIEWHLFDCFACRIRDLSRRISMPATARAWGRGNRMVFFTRIYPL
jgi:hypothetical protein